MVRGNHEQVVRAHGVHHARKPFVERLERGTVGFRLTPTRVTAKRKLSQNKSAEVVETVIAGLSAQHPELAGEMRRAEDARGRA